ncbi:MAG: class I SAM-dependent methyltransferase [Pseudomonadota bacterium]
MPDLITTWANRPEEENAMTEDHAWIWREMIRAVATLDLGDARVLDIGCNQGGFLRLLYDTKPFAEAVGIDLAQEAVALAEGRKGNRPIRYLSGAQLSDAGQDFDIAFSHEVVYLIEDLADHAAQVAGVLKPGGSYYAVTCCHRDNPLWSKWRPEIQSYSNLPVPDHSVADIVDAFRGAGFDVSANRFLANAFVPLTGISSLMPSDLDRIEVYTKWKLMFRCTWPG